MVVDDWLARAAAARPDHPAVNAVTYAELHARASVVAAELGQRGLPPGAHVGIALPPSVEFAAALHGVWRAGAVAVPIDLRLSDEERPQTSVTIEDTGGAWPSGRTAPTEPRTHAPDDPAAVIYTSGTTSAPRPVTLSFGNFLWSAIGSSVALGHPPDERWLCTLPVAHVGGLSILVRSAIAATTALVHPSFDTARVHAALRDDGVTLLSVVATTLTRLLDDGLRDPPALRCALAGGGPVPAALVRRARAAGVPVSQTYGMTESCSQMTTAKPGDGQDDAGPPLFCTRVGIADDGEIVARGPTIAGGAVLRTGDLGRLDAEGRLTVTGRKADTIVSGGENVAPQEVEAVLAEHPDVREAGVVGRPDAAWGEAVTAMVVLRPGATADAEALRAFCVARLAPFKVPKAIIVVPELPRTRSGKLRRSELRLRAASGG